MNKNVKSGCKTALKHLRDPFPAIYHHFAQYRPINPQFVENRNFGQNVDFGDFYKVLNFHDMADYSWECVQKWYLGKEIPSLESLDPFKSIE